MAEHAVKKGILGRFELALYGRDWNDGALGVAVRSGLDRGALNGRPLAGAYHSGAGCGVRSTAMADLALWSWSYTVVDLECAYRSL